MLLMLSQPPATTTSCRPSCTLCAPSVTAFMPEAHTLFTVVHTTELESPAPSAACLAGACAGSVPQTGFGGAAFL